MRKLNLRKETLITEDRILPMSGIIASTALKTAIAYGYSEKLQNMYYDLIHDLIHNGEDRPFSDGYDLVMLAACYLCEHLGEDLHDMKGLTVMGKTVTVLKGCYSIVEQEIRRERKFEKIHINDDSKVLLNLSVPFEIKSTIEETENEYDVIEMLIQRMHLTELQLKVLNYYLAEMTQIEIARALCVSADIVWESRRSIQKRYTRYIIQGKVHYKDRSMRI